MKSREGLLYSKTHEWVKEEEDCVLVGITDYAQSKLGEIVFIDLPCEGDDIVAGEEFAKIEAVEEATSPPQFLTHFHKIKGYFYFTAERKETKLHKMFYVLLILMLIHLIFDAATVYTVNHLETVLRFLNDTLHRFFIGTMVLLVYLFYQYIAILVAEETGKTSRLSLPAKIFLVAAEFGVMLLPVHYSVTDQRNGTDVDDYGVLSDFGESRDLEGGIDGAEDVYAVSEKSGESAFPI